VGSTNGKIVLLPVLLAGNDQFTMSGVLHTKQDFHNVPETNSILRMCLAQRGTLEVCCRQISQLIIIVRTSLYVISNKTKNVRTNENNC
jgi:hypothetical protein